MGEHTPAPIKADLGSDGRHHRVAIMAVAPEFKEHETAPYHPLIAQVLHGHGHASQEIAEATATRIERAYNSHDDLVKALEGLLDCPAFADIDHNDPDWGEPETARAENNAIIALNKAKAGA